MNELTHLKRDGTICMVDVGEKSVTDRMARAEAWIRVGDSIATRLRESGGLKKGNVAEAARLAGIFAAKRTADLIPLCHPLPLDFISVEMEILSDCIRIESQVRCAGRTGVEMEAMTAASVAALTVYDMVKSAAKGIEIGPVRLIEKCGGRSGHWQRKEDEHVPY